MPTNTDRQKIGGFFMLCVSKDGDYVNTTVDFDNDIIAQILADELIAMGLRIEDNFRKGKDD